MLYKLKLIRRSNEEEQNICFASSSDVVKALLSTYSTQYEFRIYKKYNNSYILEYII